ncbi:MAG: hypothetical protein J5894_04200 [Clostridia bacterium]|nr:hypothetical protein [Clostridia bacterium]
MCDELDNICRMGLLPDLTERYINVCREEDRFPNFAGFMRFCGFGAESIDKLKRNFPECYSELCMIFEDEALNADLPASVLSVYLKKRAGYDEEATSTSCDAGQLRLVFDHDIFADGK